MTDNTLYRPSNKLVYGLMFKGAVIGIFASIIAYCSFWIVKNHKAVAVTIAHPEIVAEIVIETKMALKK